MAKHVWHKCDSDLCFVCSGELSWCTVCGCGEGELPRECPGHKLEDNTRALIYGGVLDFIDDKWVVK